MKIFNQLFAQRHFNVYWNNYHWYVLHKLHSSFSSRQSIVYKLDKNNRKTVYISCLRQLKRQCWEKKNFFLTAGTLGYWWNWKLLILVRRLIDCLMCRGSWPFRDKTLDLILGSWVVYLSQYCTTVKCTESFNQAQSLSSRRYNFFFLLFTTRQFFLNNNPIGFLFCFVSSLLIKSWL